jgi:glucose-1-phosphate cytidylyltransferase
MTGGRLKRVKEYLNNEPFMLTYGDGVSDVNIQALVDFHYNHGRLATVTTVQPNGRFGALDLDGESTVLGFKEKPKGDVGWINGGFFVLNPEVIDYIEGDHTVFEEEPLKLLAMNEQLQAFKHTGFWQPMDTLRDNKFLENEWKMGKAAWKVWK